MRYVRTRRNLISLHRRSRVAQSVRPVRPASIRLWLIGGLMVGMGVGCGSEDPCSDGACLDTASTSSVDACDVRVSSSGFVGASTDPCAEGWNRIEGDLVVGAANRGGVDCVCEVTGSLQVEAFAELPSLQRVGGLIMVGEVQEPLTFPALTEAGGFALDEGSWTQGITAPLLTSLPQGLTIEGSPLIAEVAFPSLPRAGGVVIVDAINMVRIDLPLLEQVDGDLKAEELPYLEVWEGLAQISSVDGDWILNGVPSLALGEPLRLGSVGGSLIFERCSQWVRLEGLSDLEVVPGDLEILDMYRLEEVNALGALTTVGGKVRWVGNPVLTHVSGFEALESLGREPYDKDEDRWLRIAFNPVLASTPVFRSLSYAGAVSVVGNEALTAFDLPALTEVGGALHLRANALMELGAFDALASVGSLEVTGHDDLTLLESFDGVATIPGDLRFSGNDGLETLGGFASLSTVGGTVEISEHARLSQVSGLTSLTEVGGDLQIVNNPALSAQNVNDLLEQVEQVAGETEVSGNGD